MHPPRRPVLQLRQTMLELLLIAVCVLIVALPFGCVFGLIWEDVQKALADPRDSR